MDQPSQKLTIRSRTLRGNIPGQGYCTWHEYQLVEGRRVISRHDFEDRAIQARDERIAERQGKEI